MSPRTRQGPDWSADLTYKPAPGTRLLQCGHCRAWFLDDQPGRKAHAIVFGHRPKQPPKEKTPDETPAT